MLESGLRGQALKHLWTPCYELRAVAAKHPRLRASLFSVTSLLVHALIVGSHLHDLATCLHIICYPHVTTNNGSLANGDTS